MSKKLEKLALIEGQEVMEMLQSATFGGSCMGICTNKGCDYTSEVEPDQDKGYCDECDTNTVASCCVLAGII